MVVDKQSQLKSFCFNILLISGLFLLIVNIPINMFYFADAREEPIYRTNPQIKMVPIGDLILANETAQPLDSTIGDLILANETAQPLDSTTSGIPFGNITSGNQDSSFDGAVPGNITSGIQDSSFDGAVPGNITSGIQEYTSTDESENNPGLFNSLMDYLRNIFK